MKISYLYLVLGGAVSLTTACSAKPQPASAADASRRPIASDKSRESTLSGILIDDSVTKACNLPTPHFDFDSASVRTRSEPKLDALATCFTTGPMSGKSLALVGHADPRGETEYNMELGQRRAGEVQEYLTSHGLTASRISSTSRGAMDAVGTDEASWALDRHVDVTLGR